MPPALINWEAHAPAIRQKWLSGETAEDIAASLPKDVSAMAVYGWIRRAGMIRAPRRSRRLCIGCGEPFPRGYAATRCKPCYLESTRRGGDSLAHGGSTEWTVEPNGVRTRLHGDVRGIP